MICNECGSHRPHFGDNYCGDCGEPLPEDFEEGQTYLLDALPDNRMNKSGKLEYVDGNTMVLAHEDMVVEFQWSHVRATNVEYLDRETGDLYDTREELDAARGTDER